MALEISRIHKQFAGVPTLDGIDLCIETGELVCLLGPSGCGKTTLLRIVAGLLAADNGRLLLNGQDLTQVAASEREFGIVFQSYSLFPHMTVAANIGYGLKLRKEARAVIADKVAKLLSMIGLSALGDRYPSQLSGGQQQRVALARALATEPRVLLLDEPLSALDAQVRAQLRQDIRAIQQQLGIPTLMVTHDQEEAMGMADRIVCMQAGRIAQVGSAQDLYQRPANRFVAEFMGQGNLLSATEAMRCWPGLRHTLDASDSFGNKALCVRPHHLQVQPLASPLTPETGHDLPGLTSRAQVRQVQFLGNVQRLQVVCEGQELTVECDGLGDWQRGQHVALRLLANETVWVQA